KADGSTIADVTLPNSASWVHKGTKWQWKYAYGSTAPAKMQITDRSKQSPNRVKIQLNNLTATYGVSPGDEPFQAIVILGIPSLGECGETDFAPGQCVFTKKADAVKCK